MKAIIMVRIIGICIVLSLCSLILQGITPAKAQTANDQLQQCWSPKLLETTRAEKFPRHGLKQAFVKPPALTSYIMPPISPEMRGSIRRVELPPGQKLIALTLDLCEAPAEIAGYDGAIIDYLRRHNIKATLFTGGKWMMTHQYRAQQLVADNRFEIGNHAWTHGNFRNINHEKMGSEITDAQKAYLFTRNNVQRQACIYHSQPKFNKPQTMTLFRFPYGSCRADSLKMVGDKGLLAIQWDVSTGDPSKSQSAERIARQVLDNVKPGSIIIAHANGRGWNTAKALPLFIPKLIAKGYQFVTVSELLAAGRPVISQYCYDSVLGDTNRYDRRRKKYRSRSRKTSRDSITKHESIFPSHSSFR